MKKIPLKTLPMLAHALLLSGFFILFPGSNKMLTAQPTKGRYEKGIDYMKFMNPETVRQFLQVAYCPYVEKYSGKIKNYHFAIFYDEPHIHARYFDKSTPNEGVLSYSPWVAKRFRQKTGYDLLEKVELLFEEKDNWREVRLQYYRTVAEQFDESFTKQIASYCEKNGIKSTGHYLGEDGLEKVRDRIGNSMLHYRSMQQPGIDHLGLSIADRFDWLPPQLHLISQHTPPTMAKHSVNQNR